MQRPVVLIILDGWGMTAPGPGNAISIAKLEHIPKYWISYPHTQLTASGQAVGLPPGEDGNTETGHINIGAGRVVYQDFPRINMAIADGSFFRNDAFLGAFNFVRTHNSHLHLVGLVSDSAVHASMDHLLGLLRLAKEQGFSHNVLLHLFTDGRDSPPHAAKRFFADLDSKLAALGVGTIATIMGRYYGMDRDRRWERTQQAYVALTEGIPRTAPSALVAIEQAHAEGKTDEFIEPTVIMSSDGKPMPRIGENDAVIFYNFRIDRPRQLTKAFVLPRFEEEGAAISFDPYAVKYYKKHIVEADTRTKPFHRNVVLSNIFFVTMTEYERALPCTVAFPPEQVRMTLGEVFAQQHVRQLRMSETEKERFVTYYFNGLRETPFPGEDHLIIPSPKVATYDLQPAMAARELTQKLLDRLTLDMYSFVVVNFANPDMVAHTGNIPAAVTACEVVDSCVGEIVRATLARGGTCVITADHGNVEEMLGPDGEMDTEHSTFLVPFIVIDHAFDGVAGRLPSGKLADIAPTILALRSMVPPSDMTGKNLLADVVDKGGRV